MSTYLITGPSGAGKTALSDFLSARGYSAIEADSTPGLCFFINKNGKPIPYPPNANALWWDTHNYIWELDRLKKMLRTHDPSKGAVFVCGNAGNIAKAWDMFDAVFYLDIPPHLMLSRLKLTARGQGFGQRVDETDQLVRWAPRFKEDMLGLGAIPVDATRPLKQVAAEILRLASSPKQS